MFNFIIPPWRLIIKWCFIRSVAELSWCVLPCCLQFSVPSALWVWIMAILSILFSNFPTTLICGISFVSYDPDLEHREFKQLKVRRMVSKQVRGSAPGCRFRLSPHPSEDILTRSYGMPNLRLACQVNSWKHGLAYLTALRLLKSDLEGSRLGRKGLSEDSQTKFKGRVPLSHSHTWTSTLLAD